MHLYQLIIRVFGWFREYGIIGGLIGWILLVLPIFAVLWNFCEAGGLAGAGWLLIVLLLVSAVVSLLTLFAAERLHWHYLYKSIEWFARTNLLPRVIDDNTVFVGDGPGAAIVIGMLTKVMQSTGRRPLPSIVLDLNYGEDGQPRVAHYVQLVEEHFAGKKVLIVLSAVSTDSNLAALRRFPVLANARVFAFVVEPTSRTQVDFAVVRGGRHVLPWPRHE